MRNNEIQHLTGLKLETTEAKKWATVEANGYIDRHYYNVENLEQRHFDNIARFLNERIRQGYTAHVLNSIENNPNNNPANADEFDIQDAVKEYLANNTPQFTTTTFQTGAPVPTIEESLLIQDIIETGAGDGQMREYFIYDTDSLNELALKLEEITDEPTRLHLNSPGGEVSRCLLIYNKLKQLNSTVEVVIDGVAAGGAALIAMAGDKIVITEGSRMSVSLCYGTCIGTYLDMQKMLDHLKQVDMKLANVFASRAEGPSGTVDAWRDMMERETWFDSAEAVKIGLADEIQETNK